MDGPTTVAVVSSYLTALILLSVARNRSETSYGDARGVVVPQKKAKKANVGDWNGMSMAHLVAFSWG